MKKLYLLLLAVVFGSAMQLSAQDLYLRGSINDWGVSDEYKFTQSGDVYTLNVPLLLGEFKISDNNWKDQYGGMTNPYEVTPSEESYDASGTGNFSLPEFKVLLEGTITLNKSTKQVTISGVLEDAEIGYAVYGQFQGGETWSTFAMTTNEEAKVWSVDIKVVNPKGLLLVVELTNKIKTKYFKVGPNTTLSNTNTKVTFNGGNYGNDCGYDLSENHNYTFTYNSETTELTIEDKGESGVVGPEALYFFGNLDGNADWNDCWNQEMTKAEGSNKFTHKFEVTATENTSNKVGFICFCTSTMDAGNWSHDGIRYGSGGFEDVAVTLTESYNLYSGSDKCFTLGEGKYIATVTFDEHGANPTVVFAEDTETGIESIVAGENTVAPVYYNLQGVRVDNPTAGLYIVVRGNKVAKEMLR